MTGWRKTFFALLAGCVLAGAGATACAQSRGLQPLPAAATVKPALAKLGRHLFFEPRLSGDGSRSCASCHLPSRAYAGDGALSPGYNGTEYFRNAPGLLSVRLKTRLMWDGRLDGADLPTAVRDMVTEAHFMNADGRLVQERIRQIPRLSALWQEAFGAQTQPYGPQIFVAIAEFLKTLDGGDTAVDRALRGDRTALPAQAREGMALFSGKGQCVRCHDGILGTDGKAHRLGVPENPAITAEPLRMITLLRHHATMGVPNYMAERRDVGSYAVSKQAADHGRFITPGLRGLTHTGPYMHNGVIATLDEAVAFHNQGGGPGSELAPLGLSKPEQAALVAFLRAWSAPLTVAVEPPADDYGMVRRTP
jgi:cytochrome c peroxidase